MEGSLRCWCAAPHRQHSWVVMRVRPAGEAVPQGAADLQTACMPSHPARPAHTPADDLCGPHSACVRTARFPTPALAWHPVSCEARSSGCCLDIFGAHRPPQFPLLLLDVPLPSREGPLAASSRTKPDQMPSTLSHPEGPPVPCQPVKLFRQYRHILHLLGLCLQPLLVLSAPQGNPKWPAWPKVALSPAVSIRG